MNVDETDRSVPGILSSTTFANSTNTTSTSNTTNATTDDHLNNTSISHHPLSSYEENNNPNNYNYNNNNHYNNNIHNNNNGDMSEVNLETETSENQLNNNDMKKKLNWVKFDDEDGDRDGGGGSGDGAAKLTSPNSEPVDKIKVKLSPPPPQQQPNKVSAPVSSTHQNTSSASSDIGAAVLTTETVHVNLNSSSTSPQKPNSTTIPNNNSNNNTSSISTITTATNTANNTPKSVSISMSTPTPPMRTIELSTGRIREGFANGDVIVTLLPTNTKWPWITPAIFRPELVPEELMAQGLTLTVEEYVNAMETLINDFRFTVYNICYKRVLICWILFAFCVLLTLLFSGLQGMALFSLGVAWLFLNAAAIFLCMWVKLRLSRGLEKCLARVNKQLLRHKILLVLDDRGRISCHKVNLCFMYFDPALCIAYLNEFIERHEQNGTSIQAGWEKKLDLDVNDIIIQGSNPVRLSRKQALAQEIFLTYLQRWGKDFIRRRLDWTVNEAGVHETPRHLMSSICPCQYEEELLNNKIKLEQNKSKCCCGFNNPFKDL